MRVDLRYTSRGVFESFPWPQAPTEHQVETIVGLVEEILAFRSERLQEGVSLGRQYASIEEPGRNRLRELHGALDQAVADAYGFDEHESELAQLLALNESIGHEERQGRTRPRGPGGRGLTGSSRTTYMVESVWMP